MQAFQPTTMETVDRGSFVPRLAGSLAPGELLGEWRIERQIGEGGMGTVYSAVHKEIGKHAAIKVIRARVADELHASERFLQEARIVNQIQHPNIVDIFQIGQLADGRPYLVMELLHGESLGDRLDRGRMPASEAIDILLQICQALAAAHASGVVHRDLKPDNIFLAGSLVKLLDWGIAKMVNRPWEAVDATGAGSMVGTPRYVAPEQARGLPVDARTDLYSLGCIAHEMFLEAPPFGADNVGDLLVAHLREPVAPPSDVWPDIPLVLERMILGMLEKDADKRMSLAGIVQALEQARIELGARASRPPPRVVSVSAPAAVSGTEVTLMSELAEPPTPRRRWPAVVMASIIAAAAAIVVVRVHAENEPIDREAPLSVPMIPATLADVPSTPEPMPAPEPLAVTVPEPVPAPVIEPTPTHRRVVTPPPPRKVTHKPASARRFDRDATIDPFAEE
jgi:serine/threonine-protein kinase